MTERLKINYILPVNEDWYITAGRYTNSTASLQPKTKERLITYLREIREFTQSVSQEEILAVLNDPAGKYVAEDIWFIAIDYEGEGLANPVNPKSIGTNYMGMTDIYGSSLTWDAILLAREGGGLHYWYGPIPGSSDEEAQMRLEYVLPAGDDWLIRASVPLK